MGTLLSYSITCAIVLACLYLVFKVTLSDANQHSYNRAVALSIYAVAFLGTPLSEALQRLTTSTVSVSGDINTNFLAVLSTPHSDAHATWPTFLLWIYLAGLVLTAAKTIVIWARLTNLVRRGERQQKDGYTLVLTDDKHLSPFTWLRFIVMSRQDYAEYGETILTHERHHIALLHWVDLLVAQAAIIVNWFNPAAWLMRKELMMIHEYQADRAVLESGYDIKHYQTILIKKAAGARFQSLANSLNHSNLKKRITMMYQKESSRKRRFNAAALVPATLLAMSLTAMPSVSAAISEIRNSTLSVGKVTENSDTLQVKSPLSFRIELDKRDNQTKIRLTSDQHAVSQIKNLLLVADSVHYRPKYINTNIDDNIGTVDITFEQLPDFKDGTLTFDCGERTVAATKTRGNAGNMLSTIIRMSSDTRKGQNDEKTTVKKTVHTSKSVVEMKPNTNEISIITSENGGAPTERRIKIDKKKIKDDSVYIYNGKQITKAECDALGLSTFACIMSIPSTGPKVVIVDKVTKK